MRVAFVHLGRESLGIEYLSAVLKAAGHQVQLFLDPGLFGENDNVFYIPALERVFDQRERIVEEAAAWQPDIVGFSVYTNTYQWCLDVARRIRARCRAKIVFGGIHVTLVPDVVMQEECVDYAVVGEGEEAMVELADALAHGAPTDRIANVWTRRPLRAGGGERWEIVRNDVRPPIADLDALPLPDKALFEKDINFVDDYLVLASRGCIFNCAYCCESATNRLYHHRFYRRRSVDSVMEELVVMKARYRFREVMFNDAIFFTDKKWLRELLGRYRREIGVPFRCFGQVRFLDEEVGRLLRDAGCYCIEFGVQTMNEHLRCEVLNRRETNAHNARAFRICDRLGLRYDIDHIFGLPGETEADHVFAARFYSRLRRLNRLKCHNLTCFPRTPIVEAARRMGQVSEDDVRDMEHGRTGDFFHVDEIRDKEARRLKASFVVLYKVLPLLSPAVVERILRRRWYRWLHLVPAPLVIALQVVNAFRARDYRFSLYVRYYLLRLRRALRLRSRSAPARVPPCQEASAVTARGYPP